MKLNNDILAAASFIISIVFAAAGLCIPPHGVIDGSVLIWIAQLLTYSAACLKIIKKPTKL